MSKEIPLTQGYVAIVDDEDYEKLSQHRWYTLNRKHGPMARRMSRRDDNGKQTPIYMHREIMRAPSGLDVDHSDHDCLNNQRANLRVCTRRQNLGNMKKRGGFSSAFKGVHWAKGRRKWRASIGIENRTKHLGYFIDERKAARAYNLEAVVQFSEFAVLNEV